MDLNKALAFSDSSTPSSLLMELPHGWDLPCRHSGFVWGWWGWGSVPRLPYRIHPSFLCLPETQYAHGCWTGRSPVAHPLLSCIVPHYLHKPTATEPPCLFSPHFRWCCYLSQWSIMIREWTPLTCSAKKRCCMLAVLFISQNKAA